MKKSDLMLFGIPARYSLLSIIKNIQHLSCIIYKGVCSCGADYSGLIRIQKVLSIPKNISVMRFSGNYY